MTKKRQTPQKIHGSLVPEAVRMGEIRLAKYAIHPCGLSSDTVGDVVIDDRIALIQPHPHSTLYLCPICPNPQPTHAEAWFYCDSIAYEHDIPAIVEPTPGEFSRFNYRYVHSGPTKPEIRTIVNLSDDVPDKTYIVPPLPPHAVSQAFYMRQLLTVLHETRELRHGPLTSVQFRTYHYQRRVHLRYSQTYGAVAKEIGLFATALRQADFLAEYLAYYRVLEAATRSSGKNWIRDALDRFRCHKFRKILLRHGHDILSPPKNITGVYKRRAALRLRQLRKRFRTNEQIARYLYNVNRCGIAHGQNQVISGDIGPTYFEVGKDTVILKLLARMAIEEKISL